MENKTSEAQIRAVRKWDKDNYDRISIVVPIGQKEVVKAHAIEMNESLNGFIQRAINETIERDKKRSPEA